MKKTLLILLVISLSWTSQSQEIKHQTEKSKFFNEVYEKTKLVKKIPDGNGGTFTIREYDEYIPGSSSKNSQGFIIEHWDNKNKSLSYKNHEIQIDKKGTISSVFINEGKLHVLEYVKNKKNKSVDCFVHIASSNQANFERKILFSVSINKFPGFLDAALKYYTLDNFNKDNYGNISFSPDKKKIVFNIDSYEKENEKHKILVFNNNLELMWEKEFIHPTKEKLFDLKRVKIDNNGSVFILGKVYNSRKNKKNDEAPNYHFEIIKITENNVNSLDLNVGDYFISTLELKIKNDQLTCIGFFSKQNDDQLTGVSFFAIDMPTLHLLHSNFQEFPLKFMEDKYGIEKENHKELKKYSIDNIISTDTDEYLITAEEYYTNAHYYFNGMGYRIGSTNFYVNSYSSSTVSYKFYDIIVLRLSNSGELIWARNINKKQSSDKYLNEALSYSTLINDNNVYLFLNANKKIGELSDNREVFKSGFFGNINKNNSNLYLISFDKDGHWNSSIIQENKTSDVLFRMYNYEKIDNYDELKIMFFGEDRTTKQKQFLTVEIL